MVRARVLALRRATEEEMIEQGLPVSKKLDVTAVAGALTTTAANTASSDLSRASTT